MSTFDSGASGELEEIYRSLLAGGTADYRETWRVFVANARYQLELQQAVARLLRRHCLPSERAGDVTHEAMLLLAQRLEQRGDLGFHHRLGPDHFLGWLQVMTRSLCQQVLRHHRLRERCGLQLNEEWAGLDAPTAAWRAEFSDAVQSLDGPLREVLSAFQELGSIAAAARRLDLNIRTAGRRFQAAIQQLRPKCRPFTASGRLVGISNPTKKW